MQVLVYGAGQLARMMYLAGAPLGTEVWAVDVANETVVHPVSKVISDRTLAQAIDTADVLTVEFEHVPEHLLAEADKTGKLYPSMEAILVGADRVKEKNLLTSLNIPNCPYKVVTDLNELDDCVAELGESLIIKASRDGYDGYGQWRMKSATELDSLKQALANLDLNTVPLVVEQCLEFDRELSIIGARNQDGQTVIYPLAQNRHHEGQLHVSIAPAPRMSDALQAQADKIFETLANGLQYTGVLAVELFQVGNELLVNEIAPRVHNSGHWTLHGADTDQFDNHLRAILGLALGSTRPLGVSAMVNIIGCSSFSRDLLSLPGCHMHWYGKSVREKRKMGHINVLAESTLALGSTLEKLSQFLPLEHFPVLLSEAEDI
ncbi:5-(carboxyamino)imidazole ribonucleotide synthase [Alteromonas sp. 5E99-2]|uniref:5-(carboxyamino)imidazole ribonucleotide synthase n=1 Tax=Alteromonas sp. 5E99-2 TaxID=2817683 RepID=UPI001A98AF89|nr:5-(carboxyamino)imidazole ribonucleotide synthase [Alteromonas sp. 5E99-2]MBO1254587.1 5-(carboxyamino)imidazole ribonucleotide synthase [Alteromonas sp. 5E99-2]